MSQPKLHSFLEISLGTAVKFAASMAIGAVVYKMDRYVDGVHGGSKLFEVTLLFTLSSLIIGYAIRRVFNWWHHRKDASYQQELDEGQTAPVTGYRAQLLGRMRKEYK